MAFRSTQRVINSITKTGTSAFRVRGFSSAVAVWRVKSSPVLPFLVGVGIGFLPLTSVSALSWRKSTDETNKADKSSSSETVKLRNKKDTQLLKDINLADRTYKIDEGISQEDVYKMLSRHKDKDEPELLWRLARITYELSKKAKSADKERLVNEAFSTIQKALQLDEENFAVHKWMAILLNARSTLLGTKEQITQSYNVRKHMERAAELNPKDATSIYLLGNWCFTVAEIPWYQKKIASTIFATPPSCSFKEAVEHFVRAEAAEPHFYSMNLLMLAKSYLRLGEPDKAEAYLLQLKSMPMVTDEDHQARQEGKELLDQIQRSRKTK